MPESDGSIAVLILAAGQGTRMKSSRSKVLHEVAGRPMLGYPIGLAEALAPEHLVVVVGRSAEEVQASFAGRAEFVMQTEQKGTAHAVQTALPSLGDFHGDVLILYGDTPLLRAESVARLMELKEASDAPLAMLTSPEPLPGIVVRGEDGRVESIVERPDATPEQLEIREGNTGVYLVSADFLNKALSQLDDRNAQGELYLTDIVAIARKAGLPVEAIKLEEADEALGVNNRAELAKASAVQRRRNVERLMAGGVTFIDPDATYVDTGVEIGQDTLIEPGVVITGDTRIGEDCHIKPHCVIESSQLSAGCVIGPSAHIRPGCTLGAGVRLGNYVEIKNSDLGPGVKADHLSYVGDADVAEGAAFGCGSITVNYDWTDKHRTTVGKRARIGCNVNLVAPVELEDDSFVAAGTTVTKKVPTDGLAVSTGRQKLLEGWGERRRNRIKGGTDA